MRSSSTRFIGLLTLALATACPATILRGWCHRPGNNRGDGQLGHSHSDIEHGTPDGDESKRPFRELKPQHDEYAAPGLRLLRSA